MAGTLPRRERVGVRGQRCCREPRPPVAGTCERRRNPPPPGATGGLTASASHPAYPLGAVRVRRPARGPRAVRVGVTGRGAACVSTRVRPNLGATLAAPRATGGLTASASHPAYPLGAVRVRRPARGPRAVVTAPTSTVPQAPAAAPNENSWRRCSRSRAGSGSLEIAALLLQLVLHARAGRSPYVEGSRAEPV